MLGYFYIFLNVVLMTAQMAFFKVYQKKTTTTAVSQILYLLSISVVALICFFFLAGCDIAGDRTMYLYSGIACVIATTKLLMNVICMTQMNLAVMSVTTNAGTLVLPVLYGMVFLHETPTGFVFLSIALVMLAFMISFLSDYSKSESNPKGRNPFLPILLFISEGAGNIIHKAFTASNSTASNAAYNAWINVYMIIIVLAIFFVIKNVKKESFRALTSGINRKTYRFVYIGSAVGCVGMVFQWPQWNEWTLRFSPRCTQPCF